MIAKNLFKFCTAALAGSLVGIAYERWPTIKTDLFSVVSADSTLVLHQPGLPYEESIRRRKDIKVDPEISAKNFLLSSKYGLPSNDNLRIFNDFILSYDRRLRAPIWVLEHLTAEKISPHQNVSRKRSSFVEDIELHEYFRASLKDFKGSHLDRGHMAAAGNHKQRQDDLDQTFVLSNISPQEGKFNSGGWERLESYVRWLVKKSENVYVATGPLFLPHKGKDGNTYVTYRVIGDNMVSVPTHYFKVILVESRDKNLALEAFLMPNDPHLTKEIKLDKYRVAISNLDVIERASGLIFFNQLQRDQVDAPASLAADFKEFVHDNTKTSLPFVTVD